MVCLAAWQHVTGSAKVQEYLRSAEAGSTIRRSPRHGPATSFGPHRPTVRDARQPLLRELYIEGPCKRSASSGGSSFREFRAARWLRHPFKQADHTHFGIAPVGRNVLTRFNIPAVLGI